MTQEPTPNPGYQKLTLSVRMDTDRKQPIMHVNFARVAASQSIIYLDFGVLEPAEVHRTLQDGKPGDVLEIQATPQARLALPFEAAQQLQEALAHHISGYLVGQQEVGEES